MIKKINGIFVVFIALLLFFQIGSAKDISPDKFDSETDITFVQYVNKANLNLGDKFQIGFIIDVPSGYHITAGDYFYISPEKEANPFKISKPNFYTKEQHNGIDVYKNKVKVILSATFSNETDSLLIGYQVCTELGNESCYMPVEKKVGIDFKNINTSIFSSQTVENIDNKKVAQLEETEENESLEDQLYSKIKVDENASEADQKMAATALKWSLWIFLAAFLGGILDSLTPCVYPIIPVVISYMGAKSSNSKKAGFFLSLFFVIGLALTYSIVGLGASFLGGQFGMGTLASNPWVLGFVATIFTVLALSMFGVYDIKLLSSSNQTKLMTRDFSGPMGAVFLGMVSGVIAAPCVGPVLAALLMHVALVGDMLYGWVLFIVFAFGLGLLFLVIGTFSGALNSLPQAGAWMMNIKKFFGVIMIGAAIFFIKILLPEWLLFGIIGFLLILLATYIGAFKKIENGSGLFTNLGKTIGIVAVIAATLFLTITLNHFVELPFSIKGGSAVISGERATEEVDFNKSGIDLNIVENAIIEAKANNKLVVVDFWAEWCGNCLALDRTVWNNEEIRNYVKDNFVPIKLDFTKTGSEFSKKYMNQYKKYGANNPPLILFINGEGNVVGHVRGLISYKKMLSEMKRARKK